MNSILLLDEEVAHKPRPPSVPAVCQAPRRAPREGSLRLCMRLQGLALALREVAEIRACPGLWKPPRCVGRQEVLGEALSSQTPVTVWRGWGRSEGQWRSRPTEGIGHFSGP